MPPILPVREYEWDIFISHASEDKETLVRALSNEIQSYGAKVWYDEFTLRVGDSLSGSIDMGLSKSKYGLVVLSKSFLSKPWPDYELKGLKALELGAEKRILPLWHGVTRDDVLNFSPTLADKFALDTGRLSIPDLAIKIIETIRPDIVEAVNARRAWEEIVSKAELKAIPLSELKLSPVRHTSLPETMIRRIHIIRSALFDVHPLTMAEWVDGFSRDLHPENEIVWWENLVSWYIEFKSISQISDLGVLKSIYSFMFLVLNRMQDKNENDQLLKKYEADLYSAFETVFGHMMPGE